MIFDEYFDKVVILNLPDKEERLLRVLKELKDKNLCENPEIVRAVHGDSVGISDWFKWGGGAWGCMMSHVRIIQDFIMDFNFTKEDKETFENKKILILEDDVTFNDDAANEFKKLIENLPEDWGQFYLGGQHTQSPKYYNKEFLIGHSVNRTHAYAINGRSAQRIHKHICYWPDYKGENHHVDHQLEVAHRRADWKVYCPMWWIAGQAAYKSDISWKDCPEKWWDYRTEEDLLGLPLFLVNHEKEYQIIHDYLFFGEGVTKDKPTSLQLSNELKEDVMKIARAAWDQRKFPAIYIKNETKESIEAFSLLRKGPILNVEDHLDNLKQMKKEFKIWKK